MIDFSLDEDARILLDAVERFGREHLTAQLRRAEAERAPDPAAVRVYRDLGLMDLESPDGGMGVLHRCLVNEALGRADPGAALALDRLGAAGYALRAADDQNTLDAVLTGSERRAWLVTLDDGRLEADATQAAGVVHFAPAGVTDLLILTGDGIAHVHGGLAQEPVRGAGLKAAAPVRLVLDAAPVARFHRVDPAPVLARARLYVASLLLGVLEAASRYAREYAEGRVAFGRPIAHHQALTFLLVDMHSAVTGARLLLHEAAWRLDADAVEPGIEAAATAHAEVIEQSAFVGPNAVQVLGGVGFMQDYPVEKYMREARALGLLYGGLDAARDDAVREGAVRTPGAALMAGGEF